MFAVFVHTTPRSSQLPTRRSCPRNEVRLQRCDVRSRLRAGCHLRVLPFVFLRSGFEPAAAHPAQSSDYTSNLCPSCTRTSSWRRSRRTRSAKARRRACRIQRDEGNAASGPRNDASETDGKKDRRLPSWACLLYFLVTGGFAISSATGATTHTINRQANHYGGNICYPCECVAKRPGFHVWRSCTLYHNTVSIVWRRSSWNRQLKIKGRMKYHWNPIAEIKPQAFDGGLEKMTYLNLEKNDLTGFAGPFDGSTSTG